MHINDFDYYLPEELIAQHPADKRDASRLLVVNRKTGDLEHRHFYNILEYLNPGDCLVMNNSKVIPARLFGVKEITGAKVEFLLTRRIKDDIWEAMVRPGKKLHVGDRVSFAENGSLSAKIMEHGEGGTRIIHFKYEGDFHELLDRIGKIPLPPYIERESDDEDKERYQTVLLQGRRLSGGSDGGSSFYGRSHKKGFAAGRQNRVCDAARRNRDLSAG